MLDKKKFRRRQMSGDIYFHEAYVTAAKKFVSQAKRRYTDDLYEKLTKCNDEHYIYRLAQARVAATVDIDLFTAN